MCFHDLEGDFLLITMLTGPFFLRAWAVPAEVIIAAVAILQEVIVRIDHFFYLKHH